MSFYNVVYIYLSNFVCRTWDITVSTTAAFLLLSCSYFCFSFFLAGSLAQAHTHAIFHRYWLTLRYESVKLWGWLGDELEWLRIRKCQHACTTLRATIWWFWLFAQSSRYINELPYNFYVAHFGRLLRFPEYLLVSLQLKVENFYGLVFAHPNGFHHRKRFLSLANKLRSLNIFEIYSRYIDK